MSDAQSGQLREIQPGVWRGKRAGYCIQIFEADNRWVAQVFAGPRGANKFADTMDDARRQALAWIDANPAAPDHAG